jgi:thiamine-monophosphate kinase
MMDISDGIASDLQHIADCSKKSIVVVENALPQASGATWEDAFGGGEDYELLFTVDKRHAKTLSERFEKEFGRPLYNIGRVVKANYDCYDVAIEREDGSLLYSSAGWGGYHHF